MRLRCVVLLVLSQCKCACGCMRSNLLRGPRVKHAQRLRALPLQRLVRAAAAGGGGGEALHLLVGGAWGAWYGSVLGMGVVGDWECMQRVMVQASSIR